MFATLYRYPHPHHASKFIYCGQTKHPQIRDKNHRFGKSPFGRRFKKMFPGVELTQPIREVVEVQDQLELNELETIWMFRHHTWWGYVGGMNLTLPGSDDYKNMSTRVSHEDRVRAGHAAGRKNKESGQIQALGRKEVESGHLAIIRNLPQSKEAQRKAGRKSVESGQLAKIRELPQTKEGLRRAGRKNVESGWIQKLGKVQGRKNVVSGHFDEIRNLPQTKEAQRRVGLKHVESGQLDKGRHTRWHASRGIVNSQCVLCCPVIAA